MVFKLQMAFGLHVSRYHATGARPSIVAHIDAARREAQIEAEFNVTVASIFVGGPKNRVINLQADERAPLRKYIASTGIRVIAHSSYSASPWGGDPDAARYIREELGVCHEAGITGLVVHLPKAPIDTVMKYIARLYNPDAEGVRIYLETPAVVPKETYYETPEKLAALFTAIRELDPDLTHFGLCVDSAHLWTCGIDLQEYKSAERWFTGLEAVADIIPHHCVMLHFNDSLRPRGVGPDEHAGLGCGKIWEDFKDRIGDSGIAAIVDYAKRHGTPTVLERKPKEALKHDYLILRRLTTTE